jgi:hypothetical protein
LEANRRALPPLFKPGALLHSVEKKGKDMKRHPQMGVYKELFKVVSSSFLMNPPLINPNVLCQCQHLRFMP